jgi:hypothetical protein
VLLLCFLSACASSRVAPTQPLPAAAPSDAQRAHVLGTVAGFKHLGFQVVAARLSLGVDTALAWRQLDTLLAKPTGDMFWMYPAVGFYHNLKPQLDASWRARFRSAWKTYTPYRGDTENHFLMYYASLLLMSQEWPGLAGSEWFNGKSSDENHREAKEFLEHWIDETVRFGLTEWDSPRYAYYYITPLVLLRDFTADESLRRRSEMLLELLLADYAAEYLDGSYCGAHSRDSDGAVIDPRKAEVTSYAQLYFTDSISFVLPDLAYAAMSDWRCPSIIRAIAHDRDSSYAHTEVKRSRAKIRYSTERHSKVFKYDWMTPDYCLGSIQGGVHQPIQQHTWDVTFAAAKPNNTIFALHPTWSARELGTFFPEDPELMVEGVARAKASYTNENKWIGGSPLETVVQDENTLVAVYRDVARDPVRHVDLFLPRSADTVVRDTNGWWFVRFGDAFVAVTASLPPSVDTVEGAWRRVRFVPDARIADEPLFIVLTCARAAEVTFDRFVANVRSYARGVPIGIGVGRATVRFDVIDGLGRSHDFTIGRDLVSPVNNIQSPTFDGPHIRTVDDTVIELRVHGHTRTLDFARATATEP